MQDERKSSEERKTTRIQGLRGGKGSFIALVAGRLGIENVTHVLITNLLFWRVNAASRLLPGPVFPDYIDERACPVCSISYDGDEVGTSGI